MRQAKTLNVSLTPEPLAFVTGSVATGRFGSASEVVRAALRAFERQEALDSGLRQIEGAASRP